MKIAHVTNHFQPCLGGIERVVLEMSRHLLARGHEVGVICLDRCAYSDEKLPARAEAEGIRIERIPFIDLKYYKIAPAVLEKIREFDIVHVHGVGFFSDFLSMTKAIHGKPVIVTTYGGGFHTSDIGFLKKAYFGLFERLALGLADKVIAVNEEDEKRFGKITGNVTRLDLGVDIERFRSARKIPNSFIYVGRFSKNKRVERLLEVFSKLKGEKATLIIAGNDWEGLMEEYLKKNIALGIDGIVKYVKDPTDEELRELYGAAEFFVSASEFESFGVSLVEAMASGCVPIVQENEGFRHILGDSECGIALDFSDAASAAQTILKASGWGAMRKRHLGKMAIGRAHDFSWGEKIGQLEKIYGGAK